MNSTIYMKADKNVEVTKPEVTVGDIFEIECSDSKVVSRIKAYRLFKFTGDPSKSKTKKCRTVISILKVISCIHELYPNAEIENLGESDIIITYEKENTSGEFIHWIKVIMVALITFIGSAFSIMTFNNDVQLTELFSQIYELQTGRSSGGVTILELTYSFGLIIGILVFFNHFGKKRFSADPTPIEVEMRLYENDIQTTIVETYSRKGEEIGVD